jgi:hypothetical protein
LQIDNLPPAWKELFKRAGVKKADLQDPKTSLFILETIASNITKPAAPETPKNDGHSHAGSSSSGGKSDKKGIVFTALLLLLLLP